MKKAIHLTLAQAEEHQKRHGFATASPASQKAVEQVKAPKPRMNKTEAEYGRVLQSLYPDCKIRFESLKLRLADGCWYLPDWCVYLPEDRPPFLIVEVKGGHIWDDAKIKFRVAKEQYPEFEFQMQQKKAGSWARIL